MPKDSREFPPIEPVPLPDLAPEPAPEPEPEQAPAPVSTVDRLRAFEDKVFGEHHPRINDQIERGIGSPFSRLDAKKKAHHAALEGLIAAEAEHQKASEAEAAAHAKLEAAVQRAAETEEAIDG